MTKQTGYARNIFFSIIISIMILLGLGFVSITYLVPIYDLQSQDIYQFLIYLLPIILGLALIEIGLIIASKKDIDIKIDSEDLLPKNSYDSPLFETINDDPLDKIDNSNFDTISEMDRQTYSFRDSLDSEISDKISKYSNYELINLLEKHEISKTLNTVETPFSEELTSTLFSLSSNDVAKAVDWINEGAPIPIEGAVVLDNIDAETIEQLAKLSQSEASMVLNLIKKSPTYIDLENLNENSLQSLSNLNDEQVAKAINWINIGCPRAADPKARSFDNLDKDTLLRLDEYNSIQVNVGLDYIDEGAPDVVTPNMVILPNLRNTTIDRIASYNDETINFGLDYIDMGSPEVVGENTVVIPNLSAATIERIISYNDETINSGLNYIDRGSPTFQEDLPFGSELNNAIKSFSANEAKNAVNFINNVDEFDFSLGDLTNNFEDFLNSELQDNEKGGFTFEVSIAIFDKDNVLSEEVRNSVLSKLPSYTYLYDTENNNKAIVFPYEGIKEAKNYLESILKEEPMCSNNNDFKIGYSSQNNRKIDAKVLIDEAYAN
jgi:hypothetical protein